MNNETKEQLREEFGEYLRNNWEDRENLPVADFWLNKIDQALKSQRDSLVEKIKNERVKNFGLINSKGEGGAILVDDIIFLIKQDNNKE